MKAIVVRSEEEGFAGMQLVEHAVPQPALNEVVIEVRAAAFTTGELSWPSTWTDRANRDRTPSIPGHEVAGVVTELGYGTTGLAVGQRVFGLADFHRNGAFAEYVAIETRNLALLPADVEFAHAASAVIPGLTAMQGLFDHGQLRAGQRVLVHGSSGAVGSMATQLARLAGAHVIGTGRSAGRAAALDFGAHEFIDLENDDLAQAGTVDLVFDIFGGSIAVESAALLTTGGALISIAGPVPVQQPNVRVVDFVVEADRSQLEELGRRIMDGQLKTNIGRVVPLSEAVMALRSTKPASGRLVVVPR